MWRAAPYIRDQEWPDQKLLLRPSQASIRSWLMTAPHAAGAAQPTTWAMGPLSDGSTIKTPIVLYHQVNVRAFSPQLLSCIFQSQKRPPQPLHYLLVDCCNCLSAEMMAADRPASLIMMLCDTAAGLLGWHLTVCMRPSRGHAVRRAKLSTRRLASCWTWVQRRTIARHPSREHQVRHAASTCCIVLLGHTICEAAQASLFRYRLCR